MGADAACVFCKIRDGEIPSMRIYEDDRTLAFMDINLNAGHAWSSPRPTRRPSGSPIPRISRRPSRPGRRWPSACAGP
jgi:hypothetical protein